MVFYRKYRPQTLEDLAGQAVVKQTLQSAILSGKLSHAYLLHGPRGTGKTSTARIMAKIVNCENPLNPGTPCNKCASCLSITDGSNMDVIEMDAASNRGIEDIRVLRENIKLSPTSARKKVYIIDEVHMLSGDAFNALLKTLEEPPEHALFILATTELHKIPATILSRATKLEFKLATEDDLRGVLKGIAEKEKIKIDEEALSSLAKRAGGSIRDAEKLLDQLSSVGNITRQVVEESLGTGSLEDAVKLLEFIAQKKLPEGLKQLLSLSETGVNPKELNLSILDLLRQILLMKNGIGENPKLNGLAEKFGLSELLHVMDCFQKSLDQARFVSIPSLPLEMAVAESCQGKREVIKTPVIVSPAESGMKQSSQIDNDDDRVELSEAPVALSDSPDIAKIQERWVYILETVRQYNYSLEALLRSAKILDCSDGKVIIQVPYTFHQRILEAPKSRDLLQSVLSDILGRSVGIATVLGQKPLQREEVANVEIAADDDMLRIAAEIFNSDPVN